MCAGAWGVRLSRITTPSPIRPLKSTLRALEEHHGIRTPKGDGMGGLSARAKRVRGLAIGSAAALVVGVTLLVWSGWSALLGSMSGDGDDRVGSPPPTASARPTLTDAVPPSTDPSSGTGLESPDPTSTSTLSAPPEPSSPDSPPQSPQPTSSSPSPPSPSLTPSSSSPEHAPPDEDDWAADTGRRGLSGSNTTAETITAVSGAISAVGGVCGGVAAVIVALRTPRPVPVPHYPPYPPHPPHDPPHDPPRG